jgi:hypothetical protein
MDVPAWFSAKSNAWFTRSYLLPTVALVLIKNMRTTKQPSDPGDRIRAAVEKKADPSGLEGFMVGAILSPPRNTNLTISDQFLQNPSWSTPYVLGGLNSANGYGLGPSTSFPDAGNTNPTWYEIVGAILQGRPVQFPGLLTGWGPPAAILPSSPPFGGNTGNALTVGGNLMFGWYPTPDGNGWVQGPMPPVLGMFQNPPAGPSNVGWAPQAPGTGPAPVLVGPGIRSPAFPPGFVPPPLPISRTIPPGPGWNWGGQQPVGGQQGFWTNPNNGQSLIPDLQHAPPIGPHWDWRDSNRDWWRLFPDGRIQPR